MYVATYISSVAEKSEANFLIQFQAVEVRVASQGVKAKWVRIELRKVETLPGGGVGNTFYDLVGSNPLDLWTATGEYEMLHTVSCVSGTWGGGETDMNCPYGVASKIFRSQFDYQSLSPPVSP